MSGLLLVVAGDAGERRGYIEAARAAGWRAIEAAGVEHGRALLAAQTVDALVTDLHLPDGSGVELLAAARGCRRAVVVTDSNGVEVGRGITGPDGRLTIAAPVGDLTVVPQPVPGLLGTAPPVFVTAIRGQTVGVAVDYDTGIR